MSVESILTRELAVRFIDARNIVTEAKVNLGIMGYPTQQEQEEIRAESLRLFHEKSHESRAAMVQLNAKFESIKHATGPRRSTYEDEDEDQDDMSLPSNLRRSRRRGSTRSNNSLSSYGSSGGLRTSGKRSRRQSTLQTWPFLQRAGISSNNKSSDAL